MLKEIQILFVEDRPEDAAIVSHALREAGLTFRLKRVDSKLDFLRELKVNPPEVILSDSGLPSFDGFQALALARANRPEAPFIFVTGGMGEERTIAAFERGAADCVLKKELAKLGPVVQRVLREAKDTLLHEAGDADRERLIEELREMLAARQLSCALAICSSCKKIRGAGSRWLPIEIYLRDYFHATFDPGLCPDCAQKAGAKPD